VTDLIAGLTGGVLANSVEVEKLFNVSDEGTAFSARLEPAVLLRQKPNFQDAYALLRVATEKHNRRNTRSSLIIGDMPGVGTVSQSRSSIITLGMVMLRIYMEEMLCQP
jgi:hypothetical protein